MFTTIGLGGVLCLLLLILLLTVAERKARAANEERAHHTHRKEPERLTPEELSIWRTKGQKVHSDELAAMKKLDANHAERARTRSGEWKRAHPVEKKPDE